MLQLSGWKVESDSVGVGNQIVTLGILSVIGDLYHTQCCYVNNTKVSSTYCLFTLVSPTHHHSSISPNTTYMYASE